MYETKWIKMFIPTMKDYESGYKIKINGNEKTIEQFIQEDLKLDIMSDEGINAYSKLLFTEKEDLAKRDLSKITNITTELGLDLTKDVGQDVLLRLMVLDEEILKNIDVKSLQQSKKFIPSKELSFDNVADLLEEQGIIIRNGKEYGATQAERTKRNNRNLVATLMTTTYASQLDILYDDLQHYKDLTDSRSYVNHIKEAMYKLGFTFDTPTLDVAIDNAHHNKAKMEVLTQESINENLFKNNFKKLFGVDYDDNKADKLVKALQDAGGFDFNNPKVKASMCDLLGYDINANFNNGRVNEEFAGGFLSTLFMVGTMGLGGELQALNQAMKGAKGAQAALQAQSALGATGAVDKFVLKNITTNPAAKAILFGGLNFGVYSAGTTSAKLLANLPDAKLSDANAIAEGFCQSFLFGAFAAEFGMGAGKISQAVNTGLTKKLNMKVMKPLIEKFAKNPVMSGEAFMQTLISNESKIAQAVAKTTNFGLEVVGFSGYEMAMTAMNGGKPEDMDFGEYLGEVLTSQFKTLGEFKIAGFIINSRMAQTKMPKETRALLQNDKLANMEIRALNNNGKISYVMKDLKSGEVKSYKNLKEVRNRCIEIINEQTLFDKKLQELKIGEKFELDLGESKLVFIRTEDGIKVTTHETTKVEVKPKTTEPRVEVRPDDVKPEVEPEQIIMPDEAEIKPEFKPIQAKVFPMNNPELKSVYKEYEHVLNRYFFEDDGLFIEDVNAQELKYSKPSDKKHIYVDQTSKPGGTIAASSTLDQPIFTDKLYQCAALTVVDRAHNKQTLVHCFPGLSVESNRQIIEYILAQSNTQDIEISIIPGIERGNYTTVEFLMDVVNELAPEAKLNCYNVNPSGGKYDTPIMVVLDNGKISYCETGDIHKKVKNPKKNLIYCKAKSKFDPSIHW